MLSTPPLPQELFDLIIAQTAGDKDRSSLKALSFVCWAWSSTAREYLFGKVAIKSSTAAQFLDLLESKHSTLTGRMHELSFQEQVKDSETDDEWKPYSEFQAENPEEGGTSALSWTETLMRLRSISGGDPELLKSVYRLHLLGVSLRYDDTVHTTRQVFSHIQSLIVQNASFARKVPLLSSLPLLRVLKLSVPFGDDIEGDDPIDYTVLSRAFRLKEIHLHWQFGFHRSLFNWVLEIGRQRGFDGCECHLSVDKYLSEDDLPKIASILSAFSSNLVGLHVTSGAYSVEQLRERFFATVDLDVFNSLRYLTLHRVYISNLCSAPEIQVYMEMILPRMALLETLTFNIVAQRVDHLKSFSWSHVRDVLKPASFPSLRTVTFQIHFAYRTCGEEDYLEAIKGIHVALPELHEHGLLHFAYCYATLGNFDKE